LPPTTPANWFARAPVSGSSMIPAASAPAMSSRSSIQNIRYWKDKRRGRDRDGEARYEQACNRARSLGLNYVPAADAAVNLTLDDILRRFEILTRRGTADSASEVAQGPTGLPLPNRRAIHAGDAKMTTPLNTSSATDANGDAGDAMAAVAKDLLRRVAKRTFCDTTL
jgi:hypothetical protein